MKNAKDKKIEESRKEARVVQRKLLAIAAGNYQPGASKDPQPRPIGFEKGKQSKSFEFGEKNATLEEIVDIADIDEQKPIYKNANMVPIAPRRSKISNT